MIEQTPPSRAALESFATDASVSREIAMRDSGERVGREHDPSKAAITVEHVADFNRRYPGETITFYTRVNVRAAVAGFSVQVRMPAGVEIDHYHSATEGQLPVFLAAYEEAPREMVMLPGPDGDPFPVSVPHQPTRAVEPTRPAQDMIWRVMEAQEAGTSHEFVVVATILPIHKDATLHSMATLSVLDGDEARTVMSATASVAVYRGGRYLEYLPSLYEQDSFMGRFLMLFESFWGPVDQQISNIHHYFDPDLTPASFLPWLATWFDLTLDDYWSEAQQRELLNSVIWLYRRRGTRVALQRFLEIFTQRPVEILEKRAKNMTLGSKARLGVGVALGTGNQPHTFTVKLQLRPIEPPPGLDEESAAREVARLEKKRLVLIERMIVADKPAHTSYRLEVVTVTD